MRRLGTQATQAHGTYQKLLSLDGCSREVLFELGHLALSHAPAQQRRQNTTVQEDHRWRGALRCAPYLSSCEDSVVWLTPRYGDEPCVYGEASRE
jgi:hypothetical protein